MPTETTISPNSPFYVTNTDILATKLVTTPFDGTGFNGWKRGMTIALSAKNKLGFVDGSLPKPLSTHENSKAWHQCNDQVFTWILNSLSQEIAAFVLYSATAKITWDELEG
ncbi:uncharacterized protein LOC141587814 [Silene latifolia]|uniref:uncharacterized protein LOC141587814 n=1 Tax=Silene latifolia TaxID=37657 RepID=UPI003D785548